MFRTALAAGMILACVSGARGGIQSGAFSESGIGARTVGLGGAFASIADDPYAIAFNPGGLAFMERPAVAFDYADLFGLGLLKQSYFAGTLPLGRHVHSIAFQNLSVGFDPFPQELTESTFFYSYARAMGRLGVGVVGKYFNLSSDFAQGSASGAGLDVGILYRPSDALAFGASVRDLASTLKFATGTRESIPQLIRFGLSYRPSERWLVAADVAGEKGELFKELRFGTEYWILTGDRTTVNPRRSIFREREEDLFALAVRGGMEVELFDEGDVTPALGLSAGFEGLRFDYAFVFDTKELGETNRFSLVYAFAHRFGEPPPGRGPIRRTAPTPRRERGLPVVVVRTMRNATGDPALDWMERGLSSVIARTLNRSGRLEVISGERVEGAEVLSRYGGEGVAARLGAEYELRGQFLPGERPGEIILTARLERADGRVIDYFSFAASEEDVFPLGEAAAREALERLSGEGAAR